LLSDDSVLVISVMDEQLLLFVADPSKQASLVEIIAGSAN